MTAKDTTPGAQNFTFSLDRALAQGAVQVDPCAHPELLAALADPNALLPDGDVILAGGALSVAPGEAIAVGEAKVGFSADVNAMIGVFATPGGARDAILKNADLVSQVADAIQFSCEAGSKFIALRWGYDISGTVPGTVALAPAANLSFSANAGRKAYYAIVQAVAGDAKASESLARLIASWRLPSQVADISKMPVSTTLISEVDGSFGATAKLTFGYDFSWLRAIDGVGLKGDVGLKLAASLSASLGIGLSGKYAIVVSRESSAEKIRVRLFKLRVESLDVGFDPSFHATPQMPLPGTLDELPKAVTGTHSRQIMKLLGAVEDWADPRKPLFGPFVNLTEGEAQILIQKLTGVADLTTGFNDIKIRIQKVFQAWDNLPQTATRLIWSKLPDAAEIAVIAGMAKQVAVADPESIIELVGEKLRDIEFLGTTKGKALESLAGNGLFFALQNIQEAVNMKAAAGLVAQILDAGALQSFLSNLQREVDGRLDLKQLENVVDQASFNSLDAWLKARLESFLEKKLEGPAGLGELQKLRAGLKAILDQKDELYAKALEVLKRNYEFAFHAAYQSTSTTSSLLDATFNFGTSGSQAADGLKLALSGKFDALLAAPLEGVTINDGVLAFGLHKESHVALALPYFSTSSAHINDSLAQMKTVSADAGGLIFSLVTTDLFTAKNDYSSALTITLSTLGSSQNAVSFHSIDSTSYRYELKTLIANMSGEDLNLQYAPYATTYFPTEFQQVRPGTFADWVKQIAPPSGQYGNTLVSLDLSLPSPVSLAWMNAPENRRDSLYKKMSIALQSQFKQLLLTTFFSDVHNYKNVSGDTTARAVLAFCAIPACSDVQLTDDGDNVAFADETAHGKNIYWDYCDRDLRAKVMRNARTRKNLLKSLAIARMRLKSMGDPDKVLGFYQDDQLEQILEVALHGKLMDFLFPVEANMVEQARAAGLKMSFFRKNRFKNPEQARKDLAQFGQKLSEDFNKRLRVFAVGNALLPLGTSLYLTAASAFDSAPGIQPAAMLTVRILKAGVTSLTPGETDIVRTERVVHAG